LYEAPLPSSQPFSQVLGETRLARPRLARKNSERLGGGRCDETTYKISVHSVVEFYLEKVFLQVNTTSQAVLELHTISFVT
jgi:hypothetical protein